MVAIAQIERIIAGALLVAWCSAASAFSVGLKPTPASYVQGNPFSLNVVVDGLYADGEILSTYDIDIGFAPAFTFVSAMSTGALGAGSLFFDTPVVGSVNLFELSFLSDAALFSSQTDPMTVATLTFVGNTVGPFTFALSANALGGSQIPDPLDPTLTITRDLFIFEPDVNGASITITPKATVPEPATSLLVGFALLLLASSFRRQLR